MGAGRECRCSGTSRGIGGIGAARGVRGIGAISGWIGELVGSVDTQGSAGIEAASGGIRGS